MRKRTSGEQGVFEVNLDRRNESPIVNLAISERELARD